MDPQELLDKHQRRRQRGRRAAAWIISIVVHVGLLLLTARIMMDLFSAPAPSSPIAITFRKPIDIGDEPVEIPGIGPEDQSGVEAPEDGETMEVDRPGEEPGVARQRSREPIEVMAPVRDGAVGRSLFDMRTEAGIRDALAKGGGTKGTQDAVRLALRWLALHQDEDGKWSPSRFMAHDPVNDRCTGRGDEKNVVGISSLSLLCFLGSGYDHAKGKYKGVVRRGLDYLRSVQTEEGAFLRSSGGVPNMYDQALATLVMVEAAALTWDADCYRRAQRGTSIIIDGQQPLGGWDYTPAPTRRNDMSVTGWQLLTLKGAEAIGIDVPWRLKRRVAGFFDAASAGPGLARYVYFENSRGKDANVLSHPVTASTLVGRIILGQVRRGEIARLARIIASEPPDWTRMARESGKTRSAQCFYAWYYGTMGMFQLSGAAWETWNGGMRSALVTHQRKKGSATGSWDPESHLARNYGGRVYSTAMSCLCLEVYYRYLRIYEEEDQLSYGDVLLAEYREEAQSVDAKVRLLKSLAEYPTQSVKRELLRAARREGEQEALRVRAAELLVSMGEKPDADVALGLVASKDMTIRRRAMRLLARVAGPDIDPGEIIPFLDSDDTSMRMMAVRILEEIGGPVVVDALMKALGDSSESVAAEAATALREVTGMTLSFDASVEGEEKGAAIEEWRRWWEKERDAGDFGKVRLIRARVTDVNAGTGEVTLNVGKRNRVGLGQVFIVEKDVRGEPGAIRLEVVDVAHTTSRARIGEKSQAFSLAIGDAAVFDASREESVP